MGLTGLEFQNVDVKFDKGQNTFNSDKLLLPGEWEQLQNYSLAIDGTLTRRDGISTVVGAGRANGFVGNGDQVVAVSESHGKSIVIDNTTGSQVNAVNGQLPCVLMHSKIIHASGTFVTMTDTAVIGDLQLVIWCATVQGGNSTLVAQVRNMASGALVMPDTTIWTSVPGAIPIPRVAASGGAFFICWTDTNDSKLRACIIDSAAPSVVGAITVLGSSIYVSNCPHDMASLPSNGGAFVACPWNDGTNSVYWFNLTRTVGTTLAFSSGALVANATLARSSILGVGCVAMAGTNAGAAHTILVATAAHGGIQAISWLAGMVNPIFIVDPTNCPTGTAGCHVSGVATGNNVTAFWDMFGDDTLSAVTTKGIWARVIATTVPSGSSYQVATSAVFGSATDANGPHGPWMFGKPWASLAGSLYLPVAVFDVASGIAHVANDNAQNTLFLLDGATGAVVGHAFHGQVSAYPLLPYPPTSNTLPFWPALCSTPLGWAIGYGGSGGAAFALPIVTRLDLVATSTGNSTNVAQPAVSVVQFSPNTFRDVPHTKINNEGISANGALGMFDGTNLTTHGFELYPTGVYAVENGSGAGGTDTGAAVDAGVHQVVVVYEWIDAAGNRHQSAPSPAVSVTHDGFANRGILIRVPNLMLTGKPIVSIVPYVTAKSGTIFYRSFTSVSSVAFPISNYPTVNTKATASTYFIFGDSDAVLTAREALYTQPDQGSTPLANTLPAPCNVVCSHAGRVFTDVADGLGQLQFSQVVVPGVGIQFNEALRIVVDTSGGPINGLVEMDEKLIVLCRDKIFAVYGGGPDNTGTVGGFSSPSEIVSDVGASDPAAIIKIPTGILFQSNKGFHLLGRDMTVRYVGKGVEAYKFTGPYAGAALVDDRKEARISLPGVGVLVYSYLAESWSVFKYAAGAKSPMGHAVAESDSYGGGWLLSAWGADGVTYDTGAAQDSINSVSYSVDVIAKTGWLRTASINGFQRVRMVHLTGSNGGSPSAMSLLEEINDGVDGGSFTTPFTPGTDVRHKLLLQKGKSLRLTLSSSGQTGLGYYKIQGMTLQVGVKKGTYRAPSANSI